MTRQSLKLGKFMTYQVTNMFGHVQWPSVILTPVQKRVLLGLRIYVWEYTQKVAAFSPKKLLQIYLVVKERCSCSIVATYLRLVSRLHANTSSLTYSKKWLNLWAHLELCHSNPDILERVLNQFILSNSTARNWAPMQVIKLPEHLRTSATNDQKWSPFQTNYD